MIFGLGQTWFDRFSNEWKDLVHFRMKGLNFHITNDPISMKAWVNERDNYTRIQKENKSFPSKKYILVLEGKQFEVSVQNKICLNVVVSNIYSGMLHLHAIYKCLTKKYHGKYC